MEVQNQSVCWGDRAALGGCETEDESAKLVLLLQFGFMLHDSSGSIAISAAVWTVAENTSCEPKRVACSIGVEALLPGTASRRVLARAVRAVIDGSALEARAVP